MTTIKTIALGLLFIIASFMTLVHIFDRSKLNYITAICNIICWLNFIWLLIK